MVDPTFSVTLLANEYRPLGLQIDEGTMTIHDIDPLGVVGTWNSSNPSQAVSAGDRILRVNGACSPPAIFDELLNGDQVRQISVLRHTKSSQDTGTGELNELSKLLQPDGEVSLEALLLGKTAAQEHAVQSNGEHRPQFSKEDPMPTSQHLDSACQGAGRCLEAFTSRAKARSSIGSTGTIMSDHLQIHGRNDRENLALELWRLRQALQNAEAERDAYKQEVQQLWATLTATEGELTTLRQAHAQGFLAAESRAKHDCEESQLQLSLMEKLEEAHFRLRSQGEGPDWEQRNLYEGKLENCIQKEQFIESHVAALQLENKHLMEEMAEHKAKPMTTNQKDRDNSKAKAECQALLAQMSRLQAENAGLKAKAERLASQERELVQLVAGLELRREERPSEELLISREAELCAELATANKLLATEEVVAQELNMEQQELRKSLQSESRSDYTLNKKTTLKALPHQLQNTILRQHRNLDQTRCSRSTEDLTAVETSLKKPDVSHAHAHHAHNSERRAGNSLGTSHDVPRLEVGPGMRSLGAALRVSSEPPRCASPRISAQAPTHSRGPSSPSPYTAFPYSVPAPTGPIMFAAPASPLHTSRSHVTSRSTQSLGVSVLPNTTNLVCGSPRSCNIREISPPHYRNSIHVSASASRVAASLTATAAPVSARAPLQHHHAGQPLQPKNSIASSSVKPSQCQNLNGTWRRQPPAVLLSKCTVEGNRLPWVD